MRLLAATLTLLWAGTLGACGSADEKNHEAAGSTPSPTVSVCMQEGASSDAKVDLDGDGTPDEVHAMASGKCPGSVIAEVDGTMVSAPVKDEIPVTSTFGITLEGREGQLVVTRQDHPRGGFQLHVYALSGDRLEELQYEDKPLVPFVATDTRPVSHTVDCDRGKIVVREAVAGSDGSWDIRRTTYAVDGTQVSETDSGSESGNLSPKQVDQLMSAGAPFGSCRS